MFVRFVILASFLGSSALPATIHVDALNPNCPGSGTLADPYCDIQSAIVVAVTGDVVAVAPGTYAGPIDFLGKAIRVESTAGLSVTTIDGNGTGSCVRFVNGEGPQSVLTGFKVTHGLGPAVTHFGFPATAGGGIFCAGTSPTIEGNEIIDNTADYGGGVFCSGGAPTLRGNTIASNFANQGAGVLCRDHASPLLEDNVISGQDAWMGGVGVALLACDRPRLVGNTIGPHGTVFMGGFNSGSGAGVFAQDCTDVESRGNVYVDNVGAFGGAVELESSDATFEDDTFTGNGAEWDGGAIGVWGSNAIVRRCGFFGNVSSYGLGGAIYGRGLPAPCQLVVEDCTFESNGNANFGQAIYLDAQCPGVVARCRFEGQGPFSNFGGAVDGGSPTLIEDSLFVNNAVGVRCHGPWTVRRCTFTGTGSTALEAMSGTLTIENSIVWGNVSGTNAIDASAPGTYIVTDSVVEGGFAGTNVLNTDPMFMNAPAGDYRLTAISPCVDTGDPTASPCSFGLGGEPRFTSGLMTTFARIDMGAYEFSNVHLAAGPGAGGTKIVSSDGWLGLSTLLFAGFAPGAVCAYPAGTIGIDLAQPWVLVPWVPVGTTVTLTVPALPGLPAQAYLQLFAFGPQPATGNLSNVVAIPLP